MLEKQGDDTFYHSIEGLRLSTQGSIDCNRLVAVTRAPNSHVRPIKQFRGVLCFDRLVHAGLYAQLDKVDWCPGFSCQEHISVLRKYNVSMIRDCHYKQKAQAGKLCLN